MTYYIDWNVKITLYTTSRKYTNIKFLFDVQQITNRKYLMNEWVQKIVDRIVHPNTDDTNAVIIRMKDKHFLAVNTRSESIWVENKHMALSHHLTGRALLFSFS